jgi:hypothetical protein
LVVPRAAAFLFLFLAAVWLAWRRLGPTVRGEPGPAQPVRHGFVADLLVLMAVYGGLMFYAGMFSSISYGTRMFVPMVPLLALGFGALADGVWREGAAAGRGGRLARGALGAFLACYAPLNLWAMRQPRVDRASVVVEQMDGHADGGESVRSFLDRLAPGRVIVANNGQAVGYVLQRPTVSMVGPRYSVAHWNRPTLREVVARYGAAAVVITAPNPRQPDEPDLIPSSFVRELAAGRGRPWLHLVFERGDIRVYQPSAPTP